MKILITGASGFIGGRLVPLLARQHEIFVLSRRKTSLTKEADENIKMIECDLSQELSTEKLPDEIDIIIHLAQSRRFREFPEGMGDMLNINTVSTFNLLEYARRAKCQHFIYASTGSVYNAADAVLDEKDCISPKGAYAVTKYMGELLMQPYEGLFTTTALRIFFPYGPGQENMFIPNLIQRIQRGEAVSLQGNDGGLLFCPLFVDDLCMITENIIQQKTAGVINLAGIAPIRLKHAAQMIGDILGKTANFQLDVEANAMEFKPTHDIMLGLVSDTDKFVDFQSGLRQTIKQGI